MDDDTATHLVECAKYFHHHQPQSGPLPDVFENDKHALECMRDALLFEAHHSLQDALKASPDTPISNAIDLQSDTPGIVRTVAGKIVTQRSDDVVRQVTYELGCTCTFADQARDESAPPPRLTPAKLKRCMHAAEKALARAHERAERRAAESFMSEEERKALADDRRAERERKQQNKPANEAADDDANGGDVHDQANEEDEPAEGTSDIVKPCPDAVETMHSISVMGEESRRKRPKKRADVGNPEFYASPAPHDRYLQSLGFSALHPAIRDTVLRGAPAENPNVVITHGPPGCGKTHALLEALREFHDASPDARCFICGPTNISAADLHARAFARGLVGTLALSKENMPPGVPRPRAMDLRTAKFVFSTVAGRAGPRLHGERFDAVWIDEAGMIPESMVWGLLRPEVRHLWMVGDLKQLGAITSMPGLALHHQRSIMERLVGLGVVSKTLNVQRRMHPDICRYPSSAFYADELITEQADASPTAAIVPYAVVHHDGEARVVGTSVENATEAAMVVRQAIELKMRFERTVMLTPYAAQLNRLRAAKSGIEAYTVDSFQGKEADAVVLSLVRTPASGHGFWSDERRLNVALTRAKHAMRVVGHTGWNDGPLGGLIADASVRGALQQ